MSLSFGVSPFLLVVCLLGAGGLTWWVYRHTTPAVAPAKRYLLMGLRFAALFIVLFLLFQPVLRRTDRDEQPPVLAVLVDDSQSLTLADDQDSTGAAVARRVRDTMDQLPRDVAGGETRLFAFSGDTQALPRGDAAFDSVDFRGARTNISQALDYVRDELKTQNLKGVLLLSDGQYNTGRNPLYAAERYPVPIYTVVVGDTAQQRDLQIRRVTTNEIAYIDTELPVQVGVLTEDFGGERVTVSLLHGSEVVGTQRIELPEGTAEVPVDLRYTPKNEGLQRLTVSVSRLDGETTYRNNTDGFAVRVLRSKRHILMLAAAPAPDVAAVREVLEEVVNTEVSTYVQKRPGTFYEGPFPASLDSVDVIILEGYPGSQADRGVVQRVAAAIEGGTPVFFILSRQTDLNLLNTAFGDLLPVQVGSARHNFGEALFVPTPLGERHPVMEVPSVAATWWRRLPPLTFNQSRWTASPDARILATPEIRGVSLNDPLFVVRSRAGSRSAALLGAGVWRWKNLSEDLEPAEPLFPALVANTIQWLSTRDDDRLVRVEPVRQLFGGDEPVELTGQVYDESLNPVDDASVEVEVTTPDGDRFPYSMQSIGNGRYVLEVGTLPVGTYSYAARARREELTLGDDHGSFAVGALTLEFKETRANAALMRQIAQRSGGAFFTPDELSSLPARLEGSGTFVPLVIEQDRETELWHLYLWLAVVVVLLTTEWFIRKRSGMV